MLDVIDQYLRQSMAVKDQVRQKEAATLVLMANTISAALRAGNKVLAMGNGGSASDAQHFVAELVGRFRKERMALPAIALTANTSTLTAIGNDYGYEQVFARQVQGLCQKGDVVLGLSTSGRSPNVIAAMKEARQKGAVTLGLTGLPGEPLKDLCDVAIVVPAKETSFVQETHIAIIHLLCHLVDNDF